MFNIKFMFLVFFLFFNKSLLADINSFNNITYTVLNNGIKVVYLPTNSHVVTVVVAYNVGSVNEESGKEGVAHLLEHLMFLGTHDISANKYNNILKEIGATYNAHTTYDSSVYYTTSASDNLSALLQLEADRMQNLKLTQSNVESEIKIIIEERNGIHNTQYNEFFNIINQNSFTTTNYGKSVIGYEDTFANINLQDVKQFYSKWYNPKNTTIVIAGDFSLNEIKKQVHKYFGRITNIYAQSNNVTYNNDKLLADIIINYKSPKIKQEMVTQTFLVPSYFSDASEAKLESSSLFLISSILSLSTSNIYKNMVSNNNIARDFNVEYNFKQKGNTRITFLSVPALNISAPTLQKAFISNLNAYKDDIITDKELIRAKNLLLTELEFSKENQEKFAINLAHWVSLGALPQDLLIFYTNLQNITAAQLNGTFKKLLNENNILATAFKQ